MKNFVEFVYYPEICAPNFDKSPKIRARLKNISIVTKRPKIFGQSIKLKKN